MSKKIIQLKSVTVEQIAEKMRRLSVSVWWEIFLADGCRTKEEVDEFMDDKEPWPIKKPMAESLPITAFSRLARIVNIQSRSHNPPEWTENYFETYRSFLRTYGRQDHGDPRLVEYNFEVIRIFEYCIERKMTRFELKMLLQYLDEDWDKLHPGLAVGS